MEAPSTEHLSKQVMSSSQCHILRLLSRSAKAPDERQGAAPMIPQPQLMAAMPPLHTSQLEKVLRAQTLQHFMMLYYMPIPQVSVRLLSASEGWDIPTPQPMGLALHLLVQMMLIPSASWSCHEWCQVQAYLDAEPQGLVFTHDIS